MKSVNRRLGGGRRDCPAPRHSTHFIVSEAVECAQQIGARETWLIHLAHEVEHFEVEATLPERVRLAYDGLILEL